MVGLFTSQVTLAFGKEPSFLDSWTTSGDAECPHDVVREPGERAE